MVALAPSTVTVCGQAAVCAVAVVTAVNRVSKRERATPQARMRHALGIACACDIRQVSGSPSGGCQRERGLPSHARSLHDNLDTPVARLFHIVRSRHCELRFSQPGDGNLVAGDAISYELVTHCRGAAIREFLVVGTRA